MTICFPLFCLTSYWTITLLQVFWFVQQSFSLSRLKNGRENQKPPPKATTWLHRPSAFCGVSLCESGGFTSRFSFPPAQAALPRFFPTGCVMRVILHSWSKPLDIRSAAYYTIFILNEYSKINAWMTQSLKGAVELWWSIGWFVYCCEACCLLLGYICYSHLSFASVIGILPCILPLQSVLLL